MSWTYRPSLDGVRAIAVYLVVLFHSGLGVARGGFIGVDVFFVLSGFLITNVLFSDVDDYGRIRFGRFYARRVRRLLPAAVVAVAVTSFFFLLIDSVIQRLPMVGDAQSALLYVANWRFLNEQNDYFATGVDKSPFLHFWSLGIEEQFYFVFPLLLLLLVRLGRRRAVPPVAGIAVLFGLSVALQIYWASADPNHAYYGTDARAYQLLAGALLACAVRSWPRQPHRLVTETAAAMGIAALVLLGSGSLHVSISNRGLAATAAATLLVFGLMLSASGGTQGLLARPAPVYLGRISYATYLWHWPVIVALGQLYRLNPVETAVIALTLSTAIAAASYRLLEMPIRRSPALDRVRWPAVVAGVTVSALVAVALVPPVLQSSRRPAIVTAANALPKTAGLPPTAAATRHGKHRKASRSRVPSGMDWAALADGQGPGRTCDASDPQRCIVVRGHGPHILLVGDSHARMIAPMMIQLARDHDFTLSLNAISGCPWQAQLINTSRPPAEQTACNDARDAWYRDVLPKLHPDVVLLATFSRDDPAIYGTSMRRPGGSTESLQELIKNTTDETLARITATGARALILRPIITSSFDPLDCLARATYVDQCAVRVPRPPPVSDAFYRAAAKRSPLVATLDINPIVCPGMRVCSPMVDGISVWRNVNHYTPQILVHFRDQIWQAITRTGVLTGSAPG